MDTFYLKADRVDNKRPVVVILGMHRSGTSLVGNLMNAIGVDFGQDLLPATEWNAAGYWESQVIFEIHDKILNELNCSWHSPPPFLSNDWSHKVNIREQKTSLLEYVRSQCEGTDKVWGFKDPRTAVLLPMWQEIFDELRLQPYYILSVRSPEAVAASLSKRDGLSFSHSQVLWLKTYLSAVMRTRNDPVAVVDYDRWFDSGLAQAKTMLSVLRFSKSTDEALIAEAVSKVPLPKLRHHSAEKKPECLPIVTRFYSLLCRASAEGKIPDEVWEFAEPFEKAGELLNIWDGLMSQSYAERAAAIAERAVEIEANRTRLRKQRQLFTYIIIAIVVVFALASSFALIWADNWFK